MHSGALFHDRKDAGQKLAKSLQALHIEEPFLLSLPRGGVVVAAEVAKAMHAPLDVVIARKIGAPGHEEYGIGALSEDTVPIFNPNISAHYDFTSASVQETVKRECIELTRRKDLYRHGRPLPDLNGKTVIVIDDGLATGVTAIAAASFLRKLHPKRLILAVPVGPDQLSSAVDKAYDEVICLYPLADLEAIGMWYEEFDQVDDEEVVEILQKYS